MLPGIHYAGWREIAEIGSRRATDPARRRPRVPGPIQLTSGPSVDLFVFVRNKVRGIQLSLWRTYTTNGITAHLLERLYAQEQVIFSFVLISDLLHERSRIVVTILSISSLMVVQTKPQ